MITSSEIEFHPINADRWNDLKHLFEGHGNPANCWCMLWRMSSNEYRKLDSTGRRKAMDALVRSGTPVGILGYLDGEPVG